MNLIKCSSFQLQVFELSTILTSWSVLRTWTSINWELKFSSRVWTSSIHSNVCSSSPVHQLEVRNLSSLRLIKVELKFKLDLKKKNDEQLSSERLEHELTTSTTLSWVQVRIGTSQINSTARWTRQLIQTNRFAKCVTQSTIHFSINSPFSWSRQSSVLLNRLTTSTSNRLLDPGF